MGNEKMRESFEAWHESRRLKIIAESDRITAEKIADGWSDSVVTSAESTYEAIERMSGNILSFVPFQAGWRAALEQSEKLAQQAEPAQASQPYALKVIDGEICYKSKADDQSFNMWCPVGYYHGYKDDTKFFTSPPDYEALKSEFDSLSKFLTGHVCITNAQCAEEVAEHDRLLAENKALKWKYEGSLESIREHQQAGVELKARLAELDDGYREALNQCTETANKLEAAWEECDKLQSECAEYRNLLGLKEQAK